MLRKSVRILLLLVAAAALSTLLSSATFVAHPRDGVGPDICNATGVIYLHREYNTIEPYAPHKLARGYCPSNAGDLLAYQKNVLTAPIVILEITR